MPEARDVGEFISAVAGIAGATVKEELAVADEIKDRPYGD